MRRREGFEVTWEVSDGYAGGSRPHHTLIDPEDLEGYETEEERMRAIDELVRDDFDQKVSWFITNYGGALEGGSSSKTG